METGERTPLATVDDKPTDRRFFLQAALGAAGCSAYLGMIGYPVYRYLASPMEKAAATAAVNEITLKGADELKPGSALMFKFGSTTSMLIHLKDGTWSAMSAVCTHLACTVNYEPEQDRIFCACHGGVYDPRTGANKSGPPPRPLDAFKVTVQPGSVTVSRA